MARAAEWASAAGSSASWVARLPAQWRLGIIVGPTGAGKTRAVEQLRCAGLLSAEAPPSSWAADKAIISEIAESAEVRAAATNRTEAYFGGTPKNDKKAEIGMERLGAVGVNSLPVWLRPFGALSNGQRSRVSVARTLASGVAYDNFAATVDDANAKARRQHTSPRVCPRPR